mgnify:CR=1 FL=1
MAPEIAMKKKYSKSVDIWAIGIIMHIVLSGGKHPIMSSSDDYNSFSAKLVNLK